MTTARSLTSGLPGIAFATIAITGETIALCRGEPGYYRVETAKTAEELNKMYGVTPAKARAMLAGTLRLARAAGETRHSRTWPTD